MDRNDLEQFVEEGSAFLELARREGLSAATAHAPGRTSSAGRAPHDVERFDVIVIGGGQAGLSVGYHLARHGLRFVILDAEQRIGDTWRRRWDSLRLFTPARYNGLDGLPFPDSPEAFPGKDAMGDFLETYARRFGLPVRSGTRVDRLTKGEHGFVVHCGAVRMEAPQVVVAMANYQQPRIPEFAGELHKEVVQLHAGDYRNPAQLREGAVLIVGGGNSGSEIAMELCRSHQVWMAGRDTGHIPFRIDGRAGRMVLVRLVLRVLFHRILTVGTSVGRRARPKIVGRGGPLIRVKPRDLRAAGVQRLPRVVGTHDGQPLLDDGRVLDVANVVWCTGFEPGFSWIDLPAFDAAGEPLHESGVVRAVPGLYFVGLHFLHAMSSSMIHGVGRDAARIADHVVEAAAARRTLGAE